NEKMKSAVKGKAFISVNKAVVTRAAAVIPAISLYISILFKIMKEKGLHEGCIEQMYRLFDELYSDNLNIDDKGRVRMDNLEMRSDIQEEVSKYWTTVNDSNLKDICDIDGYMNDFLNMHGFGVEGIDYSADVENL
ncbi:MAG: bifunctional NADH-specific enoyl-ACP reductase/trans-2-enoyl-CoA reductase, partial [Spirochaetales bacterium]|nr:bifunctional NADH-specific enoyl-ACP reductase/trans-2-enoyl-CoA reductase [Spirochaetales bacterium]